MSFAKAKRFPYSPKNPPSPKKELSPRQLRIQEYIQCCASNSDSDNNFERKCCITKYKDLQNMPSTSTSASDSDKSNAPWNETVKVDRRERKVITSTPKIYNSIFFSNTKEKRRSNRVENSQPSSSTASDEDLHDALSEILKTDADIEATVKKKIEIMNKSMVNDDLKFLRKKEWNDRHAKKVMNRIQELQCRTLIKVKSETKNKINEFITDIGKTHTKFLENMNKESFSIMMEMNEKIAESIKINGDNFKETHNKHLSNVIKAFNKQFERDKLRARASENRYKSLLCKADRRMQNYEATIASLTEQLNGILLKENADT